MAGLSQGAFVVNKKEGDAKWIPMLNELPDSVGTLVNGDSYEAVIALAVPATLTRLRFDSLSAGSEKSSARHAQVQVSAQGEGGPWQTVFDADLARPDAGKGATQDAALAQPARAHWLRVVLTGGADGMIGLKQFMAFGMPEQAGAQTRDISGVYRFGNNFDSSGFVVLRQEGSSVTGCYGDGQVSAGQLKVRSVAGTLTGGVEPGTYLRFVRDNAGKGARRGVVSFSQDGKQAVALEFPADGGAQARALRNVVAGPGWKLAAAKGTCPGAAEDPLTTALEQERRVALYGVNFDLDSDVLRGDSRPALDAVVKAARAHPDWKLGVEGHTDNAGGEQHNQGLSERRAASVVRYLTQAGIAGDRLSAQGFGASKPVAPNETPAGRAQNRRVELARQ
ncbi:hypothetical protein OR16_28819 [Cupriavidus basilensis OR16]|uniref:OmpA-like domain-containing protein n=1 Tax=Cupriavidus basilensis OR16 TaxID=1127483 RepID=H1SC34_9BURK|nr:OmpA family protein [Cupriavidus basilensis]EHP39907.1 hypothetical protein OR16_28819 [Cupriavidus basilensis OR16]